MAATPYFIISPNTVLSLVGFLKGRDRTIPTPVEDWRKATVDVVIPTYNEERNIPLCLASLMRQTVKPENIYIIDDGSRDNTIEYAQAFSETNGINVQIIKRKKSIGKTPTLKRQSRETGSDVQFILDGDTILESDNYIERTVRELYKGVGIGSSCGTIFPLRKKDREKMLSESSVKKFLKIKPFANIYPEKNIFHRIAKFVSNVYRDTLYMFLQKFIYRGQMVFYGSITNPVGCAVAYRRKYIKDLFDKYEPILGDNLTNSEDIFIGFALLNNGYRNIQVDDVYARSLEPRADNLPKQIYKWSSSYLQSCFYFNDLLMSPFRIFRKRELNRSTTKKEWERISKERKVFEAYRQPFGENHTKKFGRPAGWGIFFGAFEKVAFPTTLLILIILGLWEVLLLTIAVETVLSVGILLFISRSSEKSFLRGIEYFLKGIILTPVRYLSILYDMVTIMIFGTQLWVLGNRNWKK